MIEAIPHTIATQGWWVVSRASGLVAITLAATSVALGLTMAGRPLRRPGLSARLRAVHEQTALACLVAIGVHGAALLADPWLKPGLAGVTVPFAMSLHTFWTGLGVLAGYLAVLLGLSFYLRGRLGPRLWRTAHRATVLVYVLGLVHALGAGSDASSVWFRAGALLTALPIALLFVYRLGVERRAERRRRGAATGRLALEAEGGYEQSLTIR